MNNRENPVLGSKLNKKSIHAEAKFSNVDIGNNWQNYVNNNKIFESRM